MNTLHNSLNKDNENNNKLLNKQYREIELITYILLEILWYYED